MEHPLTAWRASHTPPITKQGFADSIGRRRKTIDRVERFEVAPSYELARSIEEGTRRAVRIDDMINPTVRAVVRANRAAARARAEAKRTEAA